MVSREKHVRDVDRELIFNGTMIAGKRTGWVWEHHPYRSNVPGTTSSGEGFQREVVPRECPPERLTVSIRFSFRRQSCLTTLDVDLDPPV